MAGSTRERILDVALELFAEEGFSGTSISEIERRVGLSTGSGAFYRHFASKEDVLKVAVEREVHRFREQVQQAEPAGGGGSRRAAVDMAEMLRRALHELRQVDRLFKLMLNEGDRVPELREAIWAALEPPDIGQSSTETIAMAALGGYHLFSLMQGRPYNGLEEHEFIDGLARLFPA